MILWYQRLTALVTLHPDRQHPHSQHLHQPSLHSPWLHQWPLQSWRLQSLHPCRQVIHSLRPPAAP